MTRRAPGRTLAQPARSKVARRRRVHRPMVTQGCPPRRDLDRRQGSRRFGRLKTGQVGVRGGWRIYSSGPGIFLNQLISNLLGLRTLYDDVVFDPVLPRRADGLTFDVEHDGRPVRYRYHVAGNGFSPRAVRVNGRELPGGYADNPYRPGGLLISKHVFSEALDRDENLVEIFI